MSISKHVKVVRLLPLTLLLAVFCFADRSLVCAAESPLWPQFGGNGGDNIAHASEIPTQWSETKNILWKCELPGKGYSSPVINQDQIWLTAAIDEPATEEEKERRLKANTGNQPLVISGRLSLRALCVDKAAGKLLHDVELMTQESPQPIHALNSFASPTPVLSGDGKRLYCHFGAYGTAAVDTQSGKVLWSNREHYIEHENGPGSSPVLVDDLLIFHCDGSDKQYLTALDVANGKTVWKTDRSGEMNANPQLKKAYGTPLVLQLPTGTQIISPAADWLYVYDAATGKEISKTSYGVLGFSIVPKPAYSHGTVYMSTSFMRPEILAFKYDGSQSPEIAWRFAKQAPTMSSPLAVGDELYIVSDKGIATCLDAKSGDVHWTERLEGNYSASPMLVDGKILFSSREGHTSVVKPGKTFELLAVNSLDGSLMASPIAVESSLFLRTDKAIYRIGQVSE